MATVVLVIHVVFVILRMGMPFDVFVFYYMFLVVRVQVPVVVYMTDITVEHPLVPVIPRMLVIFRMFMHMVVMFRLVAVTLWFVPFAMHMMFDMQVFSFITLIGNVAVISHMLVIFRVPVFL